MQAHKSMAIVGIGGAGCQAVPYFTQQGLANATFLCLDSDYDILEQCKGCTSIQLRKCDEETIHADQEIMENQDKIVAALGKPSLVFVLAGMGGLTASVGISPLCRIAREEGAYVAACVTTPFTFEGARRRQMTSAGLADLRPVAHHVSVCDLNTLLRAPQDARANFAELTGAYRQYAYHVLQEILA